MPRPRKCRKVCRPPVYKEFHPADGAASNIVLLTVDEYETISLIDMENFSQEDCASYMQIGRTTAQRIYNNARKKLATVLVTGAALRIEGGNYRLCNGKEKHCGCGGCHKHRKICNSKEQGDLL